MATNGTGTTITFGTSSFTASHLSIGHQSISRESLETSHLGTTNYRTFMPGDLTDPGEIPITFQYDPDEQPPINQAAETVTIEYPSTETTGAQHAVSAFLTDFEVTAELETVIEASATLKCSGTITFTDATS